jgi:hypothetical protein
VAWWEWHNSSSSGLHISQLPQWAFSEPASTRSIISEGVKRDLLAGSVLEKKAGDRYYFPHRSFVEFLVAEYICFERAVRLDEVGEAISPEIVSFIKESGQASRIVHLATNINGIPRPLPMILLELVAWGRNKAGVSAPSQVYSDATPRNILVDCYRMIEQMAAARTIADYLNRSLSTTSNVQSRLMSALAALDLYLLTRDALFRQLQVQFFATAAAESLVEMKRLVDAPTSTRVDVDMRNPFACVLGLSCKQTMSHDSRDVSIGIDLADAHRALENWIDMMWQPQSTNSPVSTCGTLLVTLDELATFDMRLRGSTELVAAFFTRFPDPSITVPLSMRPKDGSAAQSCMPVLTVETLSGSWQNTAS